MTSSTIEGKDHHMSISVVIPAYNCAGSIRALYERLSCQLASMADNYEIILVEDCGTDDSWKIISEIALFDPKVKAIQLRRNYGQHNAVLCGIRQAQYEIIVTMDDDLQHPPEEIPCLLHALNKNYDVVYGTSQKVSQNIWRKLASQITRITLQSVMGYDVARKVSAFRAFRREILEAFINYYSPFVSIDVLLTWGTNRFSSVNVQHSKRAFGKSQYTFLKLVTYSLNMATGYSVVPLQIASLIGFVFTIFGICILSYILISYLIRGSSVHGFTFLASIIAIFSGAQLFSLGIIGEYLARVHFK